MPRYVETSPDKFAATVEMREIPDAPDMVACQVSAASPSMVLAEVNRIMRQAEMRGGVAEFRTVARAGERWQSRGYVSKPQDTD